MSRNNKQSFIVSFLSSPKAYPLLAALAAGLYPVLFYYSNNYTFINSKKHLAFFVGAFLLVPICVIFVAYLVAKLSVFKKIGPYVVPFLNIFLFLFFIQLCIYAKVIPWLTIAIGVVALVLSVLLLKSFKKIILLELILAVVALFFVIPIVIQQLSYSRDWMEQPDAIEEALFRKKPNVYYIQPDGYVNFSELTKGNYNLDVSQFKNYLLDKEFTLYDDTRSNYSATLVSNSATFSMKHHYYNHGFNFSEMMDARKIIITSNPVLEIFKNNGYTTHFLAEWNYLLANKPKMGYHKSNFKAEDVPYLSTGFTEQQDVFEPLQQFMAEDIENPKFFFIEIFKPGHVTEKPEASTGIEGEKKLWDADLELANQKLTQLVDYISDTDPQALILIMADHGGYVGLENMKGIHNKNVSDNNVYSAASILTAIKWPDAPPSFDGLLKTPVNTFRILFSYLAENERYLEHLQEDATFFIIDEGAPKGVYKRIDANYNVIFEKVNAN